MKRLKINQKEAGVDPFKKIKIEINGKAEVLKLAFTALIRNGETKAPRLPKIR